MVIFHSYVSLPEGTIWLVVGGFDQLMNIFQRGGSTTNQWCFMMFYDVKKKHLIN